MTKVEQYARDHQRFHPAIIKILQPLFVGSSALDLAGVKFKVLDLAGFAALRAKLRLPMAWIFVLRDTVIGELGRINVPSEVGRGYDLSTPGGMAVIAHELVHVVQWRKAKWKFMWQFVIGVITSRMHGKWYLHSYFPYEQEAIAFQNREAVPYLLQADLAPMTELR